MRFDTTSVNGTRLVTLDPRTDERGFFARLFCREEFKAEGLESEFVQVNNSLSLMSGTLRGLHYQVAPAGESKLVRCVRGRVFDVVVDMRANSPTFCRWFAAELNADNRRMMYVPKGCAHGYLTLEDNTELIYFASHCYEHQAERILRWNDPAIGIEWPRSPHVISDKDDEAPDFSPSYHASGY
jgi:dTDP-4-dehydrorhamnose 3,5-epimerase